MVDLTAEMAQLWTALGAWTPGRARVVQFVSAEGGEGASTIAREFARLACDRVRRPVWLVDLDLPEARQHADLVEERDRFGELGPEKPATPDGSVFFTVQPPLRDPGGAPWPDARYLGARQAGESKLWVTRFREELLRGAQQAHIVPRQGYWNALRRHADVVAVDSPAADRSTTALTLAPFMDATVLVVSANGSDVRKTTALRDGVIAAGGRCAGIVFNRAELEPPAFLKAILS
jgi:Mrp family chromosome partitioning ATPase